MSKNELRPMKRVKPDTTFECIMAYYVNPDNFALTDKQEEIRQRWHEVFHLRLNKFTKFQIAKKLQKDYGLSPDRAYKDIKNSEMLFGEVMKSDKEGTRVLLFEHANELYRTAVQKQDLKAQSKALELMAQFGGIMNEDTANFNPEKLENLPIEINLPPHILKILEANVNAGVVDFNKLNVVDIPFETIKEEDATEEEES